MYLFTTALLYRALSHDLSCRTRFKIFSPFSPENKLQDHVDHDLDIDRTKTRPRIDTQAKHFGKTGLRLCAFGSLGQFDQATRCNFFPETKYGSKCAVYVHRALHQPKAFAT